MKTYKLSKARRDALIKKYGKEKKEFRRFNEEKHKLIAYILELDFETEYKVYYCLLNKYKDSNLYYNYLYNAYLENGDTVEELNNIAWCISKIAIDIKEGYKLFTKELENLTGVRKTTERKAYFEDCMKAYKLKNVYIKKEVVIDFKSSNLKEPSSVDNYISLEREDLQLLNEYLQKVLTKKQYTYILEFLKGKHSFAYSGKMSQAIKEKLKNDTLLKYLKCD